MSAQAQRRRLSPLLEPRAITAIAGKLWTVRNRLSLHTDGNVPSPVELGAALYLHMQHSDARRLAEAEEVTAAEARAASLRAASPTSSPSTGNREGGRRLPPRHPSDAPSVRLLSRLLAVSDATYWVRERSSLLAALARLGLPAPVAIRAQADKWAPGYVVVRDERYGALLLSVRGSRDVGDLLTNLSSDAEPFLAGTAHQGVVNSARNLHARLRPLLAQQLSHRPQLRHGLIVVGHSLGGAVAAALTMLLRYARPPSTESPSITSVLASARCYSFAPPPFLCEQLATRSKRLPIITVAYGLDVVPRLSPATIDRLLLALSAYDFSPHVSSAVSKLVRSVTMPVLGEREATSLAERAAGLRVDARVLANVSGTLADVANHALHARSSTASEDRAVRAGNGGSGGLTAPSNSMWASAVNAMLFATRALGSEVHSNASRYAQRREQSSAGVSRRRAASIDHIDDALSDHPPRRRDSHDNNGRQNSLNRNNNRHRHRERYGSHRNAEIPELYLAGDVWHIDRPFVVPTPDAPAGSWPVPSLVRRRAEYFQTIEVSAWMLYDHDTRVMGKDLIRML